jgi:NAD(P)-dependent dehydrogenase (short-subunit alcohol dehydrogenase family)
MGEHGVSAKIALVTGGSRGIGRATVLALAENGYDVGINYVSDENAAAAVRREVEARERRAVCIRADVSRLDAIDAMFETFLSEFGRIDLLVNNAGISRFAPFLETTPQMWEQLTFTDWRGPYFCAQRAAREMVRCGAGGVIVNITSNQQEGCWPQSSAYGPTKAAVLKFTAHAAMELAPHGIRVVAVAPGYTHIEWLKDMEFVSRVSRRLPLGRFATPAEIASAVLFLASPHAAYITGVCLKVDGGALLPVAVENSLE